MELSGITMEHGMEVEQCVGRVPREIWGDRRGNYLGEWGDEYYDQKELESLGPMKQVKSLLDKFNDAMRRYDDERPWEWSSEDRTGHGCGSHAHLAFDGDAADDGDEATGMAVTWNTTVELAPFLAPFWCFDWENGFRSSSRNWASAQTTRYSPSTMRNKLDAYSLARDTGSAVTLNPSSGDKPVTVEVRLNENHPAFALPGVTYLRRTATKAMRKGWSPKLAGDRRSALRDLYDKLHRAHEFEEGVVGALKAAGPFRFEEGRGIPGSDQLEFETAWDVLVKVMAVNGVDRGAYDDHVKKLILAAGSGDEVTAGRETVNAVQPRMADEVLTDGGVYSGAALGPQNNTRALWHTTDPDFSWDVGPDVDPRYD